MNTFKRFFKCGHCSNRTVTLDLVVPLEPCRNCGMSRWERAPMLRVGSILCELHYWTLESCGMWCSAIRVLRLLDPEDRGIMILQNIKNTHPTAQCHTTQDVNLHVMHSLCCQLLFVIVLLFATCYLTLNTVLMIPSTVKFSIMFVGRKLVHTGLWLAGQVKELR